MSRRDRADPVELCAGGSHGGFHRQGIVEIVGMSKQDEKIEEGEIDLSGEMNLDRLGELAKELEEVRQHVLYAQAETQNVRRRLEQEKVAAAQYAATAFARDMLSVKDNLERALSAIPEEMREDERTKGLIIGLEATGRE